MIKLSPMKPVVITRSKTANERGWLKKQEVVHTFTSLTKKQLESLATLVAEGNSMVNIIAIARNRGIIPKGMKISDKQISIQLIDHLGLKNNAS